MKLELKIVDFLAKEGKELTIHELSVQMDEFYSYIYRTINRLAKEGVITKRKAGKAFLCSLKFSEKALAMLKLAELEKKDDLFGKNKQLKLMLEDFMNLLKTKSMTVVLFGSYSKGAETEESDIDVLLIAKNKIEVDRAVKEIYAKYGKEISVVNMTEDEFKKQKEKPIIKEIIKSHCIIYNADKFVNMVFEK